jgi:hypothetical protein
MEHIPLCCKSLELVGAWRSCKHTGYSATFLVQLSVCLAVVSRKTIFVVDNNTENIRRIYEVNATSLARHRWSFSYVMWYVIYENGNITSSFSVLLVHQPLHCVRHSLIYISLFAKQNGTSSTLFLTPMP